ncbi:G2/mitotic-specific cyclin-B1 isoform X1 [Eurytemora carolleeae]|uniref:G2/mitotic-specific cyclin-B1 isoform X1 n=1 Tax=Eurytemora carolleeae TaxID=1294199 RepID=UPI000C7701FF|nr:G2/mitotic-specific cyclin-B1 isoform X1 [Eurytemora carolleeae]|eukprot:XP_023320467.1 G2/mitotic-specific cyclin-B1-like isoform X1 [Eurytemora affinis]
MALQININSQNLVKPSKSRSAKHFLKGESKIDKLESRSGSRKALADIVNRDPLQQITTSSIKREPSDKSLPVKHVQDIPVLPSGVHDIDAEDEENPQLCTEYAPLMYAYLRQLEQDQPIRKDFLKNCHVNGKMRGVLLDWLVEVHLQFKLLQETLYMAIFIIDRFLQVEGLTLKRNRFQLIGVSAMFIASKVEEMYAPEINDFVYITDDAYSAAEIRKTELRILQVLNFGINRPLPLHFLRRFSKAGDVDIMQHTLAKYLVELSQIEYDLSHLPPSQVAASSLYLSLLILTPGANLDVWNLNLQHYSCYESKDLLPTVCRIAVILQKAPEGKLKAVYTKYCEKKFMRIASCNELKVDIVAKLASKHLNSIA